MVFKLHVTCKRKGGVKDTATMRMVGGELENEKGALCGTLEPKHTCLAIRFCRCAVHESIGWWCSQSWLSSSNIYQTAARFQTKPTANLRATSG